MSVLGVRVGGEVGCLPRRREEEGDQGWRKWENAEVASVTSRRALGKALKKG